MLMKTVSLLTIVVVSALLAVVIGCSKKAEQPQQGTNQQQSAVQPGQHDAASDAAAEAKAQEILSKAWSLVDEGKYREAQEVLRGLSGMKLTEAQKRGVQALTGRIQQGLATQQRN